MPPHMLAPQDEVPPHIAVPRPKTPRERSLSNPTLWLGSPTLRLITQLWTSAGIVAGLLIAVGGPTRWAASTYAFMLLVPGSPYIWGLVLVLFATLALVALQSRLTLLLQLGLHGAGLWAVLFAVGALLAALSSPTAALGITVWVGAAAINYFLLAALWRS